MRRGKSLVKRKEKPTEEETEMIESAQAIVASRVVAPAPLDGFGEGAFISFDAMDDDASSHGGMAMSNSSLASVESSIDIDLPPQEDEDEDVVNPKAAAAARDVFKGAVYEEWPSRDIHHAHISLLCVKHPLTLRGPCALYGLGGETSLDGYLLGSKHFILHHKGQAVCAAPVKKSRTEASESIDHAHLDDNDPEELFGKVDWGWVKERLESWKRRLPTIPSIVLIVTPKTADRHMWFETGGKKAAKSLPSFIARRPSVQLEVPFLEALKESSQNPKGAVVMVGEQNIGKSTLGMAMANAFLSQHGRCYWLDLDLGQPAGSLPSSFSLCEVIAPIRGEGSSEGCFKCIRSVYVGSSRILCPISAANALNTLLTSMLSPDGNEYYPLVVNTHGYVRSTGRRPTLEVIRRLKPTQVFHLCRAKGEDYDWLNAESIQDPTLGLNTSIVPPRFLASRVTDRLAANAPGTGGYVLRRDGQDNTNNAFGIEVTETVVRPIISVVTRIAGKKRGRDVKEDVDVDEMIVSPATGKLVTSIRRFFVHRTVKAKVANHQRRRDLWNRHFNVFKDISTTAEGPAVMTLNTGKLSFVATHGDETSAVVRSSPQALADLLHGSVISVSALTSAPKSHKPSPLNTCLYTDLTVAPVHCLFGLVTAAVPDPDGSVTIFLVVRSEDLVPPSAETPFMGLVVGVDDRIDTAQAVRWALKSH